MKETISSKEVLLKLIYSAITEKGIGTLLIENLFQNAIKKYLSNTHFDLILYSTPPITFSNIVRRLKNKNQAISYLLLKDIFPQNAVDINLFSKNSLFYKYFRAKEKKLYEISDFIGCMSPANVSYILEHNPQIHSEKVEVNPNSIALKDTFLSEEGKKQIRLKYQIPIHKKVFIYGGNLGKPQGLYFLLEILQSNLQREDIFFLIVGTGTEYKMILSWFDLHQPTNAKLLKGLPKEDYDLLVASCDVGLIFLDPRFTIPNYPSRLLSYLENKMPIIAATDSNTDIGTIAQKNGYGYACLNGDLYKFNHLIKELLAPEKTQKMGMNGYNFLKRNYMVNYSYQIILNHFLKQ